MRAFSRPPNLKQHKTDKAARMGGFFAPSIRQNHAGYQ
jgi:hypothetical protein|nr:MAG TPA: hypothetical protein [Caudoviricetes sp.]